MKNINIQINKIIYPNIKTILPYLIFALIVFSVKLMIIANYGNATPFWDQWNGEGNYLYRPFIEGNLNWSNLFAPHNEHRILTTRLLALILLYLNGGVWNPILQMQVNAVIHVFAIALLLFYIAKVLTSVSRNALLAFCIVVFSIPLDRGENTLWGFQVQFYFLLLFSFLFLWAMSAYKSYSTKWWLGIIAGVLSFLSFASGAITLIAGTIIVIFRRYINKEKNEVVILAILILIALSTTAIVLTPVLPYHDKLKAHSILQFIFVFAKIFSWPTRSIYIGMFVIHTPMLLLIFHLLYKKEYRTTVPLFLAAIALWLFGQFTIIAYGRNESFTAYRYNDLFAIGLVVNFASLAILLDKITSKTHLIFSAFGGLWIATVLLSFERAAENLNQALKHRFTTSLKQEKNVRAYLCTGDFLYLQNKPRLDIPYFDPVQLKNWLDDPIIRTFLPGNIYALNSNNPKTFCNLYANEKPLISQNVAVAKNCIGIIGRINGTLRPKQFSISNSLNVVGWLAPSPTQVLPAAEATIVVLTDSKGKNLFFRTQKSYLSDVGTHFKNIALNATGFSAIINVSLMTGDYTLGLGFIEGKTIKLCPQFKIRGTINK